MRGGGPAGAGGGSEIPGAGLRPTRPRIDVREVLGVGGFGAVYLAKVLDDSGLDRTVAIKVLSGEMANLGDIAGRQRDEARLLALLNHPAIVKVYDLREIDGRPVVFMEYVDGVDCSVALKSVALKPVEGKNQGLPARSVFEIVATVASALDAAWNTVINVGDADPQQRPGARGGSAARPVSGTRTLQVVHRDIKPANLLLGRYGGVKVLDFGVARSEAESREGLTASMQFGTTRYMAPEQWLYGRAGRAVDIYALGVTLVELLTGGQLIRAPLQPERFAAHLDSVLSVLPSVDWDRATRQALDDLVRGMFAFHEDERMVAADVQEQALALAERAPGEGLARFAPRVVPGLMAERAAKMKDQPLPDPAFWARLSERVPRPPSSEAPSDAVRSRQGAASSSPDPDADSGLTMSGVLRLQPRAPQPVAPAETYLPEDSDEPAVPAEVPAPSAGQPSPLSLADTYIPDAPDTPSLPQHLPPALPERSTTDANATRMQPRRLPTAPASAAARTPAAAPALPPLPKPQVRPAPASPWPMRVGVGAGLLVAAGLAAALLGPSPEEPRPACPRPLRRRPTSPRCWRRPQWRPRPRFPQPPRSPPLRPRHPPRARWQPRPRAPRSRSRPLPRHPRGRPRASQRPQAAPASAPEPAPTPAPAPAPRQRCNLPPRRRPPLRRPLLPSRWPPSPCPSPRRRWAPRSM